MMSRSRKISAARRRRFFALALALMLVLCFTASAFAKSGDSGKPAGDTTTIGADAPTGAPDGSGGESSSQEGSGESDAELERRKETYTIGAMITLGAILVGLRERNRRR